VPCVLAVYIDTFDLSKEVRWNGTGSDPLFGFLNGSPKH
jgi:hypothetical protein